MPGHVEGEGGEDMVSVVKVCSQRNVARDHLKSAMRHDSQYVAGKGHGPRSGHSRRYLTLDAFVIRGKETWA